MKKEPGNVKLPWDRSKDFLTSKDHLNLFYSALRMVENDDSKRLKGYNWKKLKSAIGSSIGMYSSTEQQKICIPNKIGKNTIYIKDSKNIAANFIKCLRHAFAHNYVRYDDTNNMIEIYLPSYDKKSVRLRCLISYKKLRDVVEILNQQKKKTI